MKTLPVLAFSALVPSFALGASYDEARVIDVQPLTETVSYTVPRQVCSEQRVATGSYGGTNVAVPVLGAIAGGVLGSAVAHGHDNKRAGAAIGAVFGGAVGYDYARRTASPRYTTYDTQNMCTEVQDTHEEERVTGYRVRYEYLGETYVTTTANPPGDTVRVRVDVTPAF